MKEKHFTPKLQSNKGCIFNHDSEIINIRGEDIEVDPEMAILIKELNKLGLETMWCCAGDKKRRKNGIKDRAYITFKKIDGSPPVSFELIYPKNDNM